jgi:DNA-binding MarR family transcriptional regulator
MKIVLAYLNEKDNISSTTAALILDVHVKTASRLLKQGEEIGLFKSEGKTRDKMYKIK